MPRIGRIVAVGYPHHITQRGNYRQKIFSSNAVRKEVTQEKELNREYEANEVAKKLIEELTWDKDVFTRQRRR